MSDTPNFRFNRKPRFSVNHLTSYLSTANAGQRDRVIQQAKFPKKIPVAMYGQARRAIQGFWGTGTAATGHFDITLAKLQRQARNEADSRKNMDDRRRQVASLVRWALEENGQIEPLPSLCLSFDIFGDAVVKSPDAKDRFRDAVDQSCKEVALKWESIEPPSGYDGPDWR